MQERKPRSDRRIGIADAGIRIIADQGVRALTHRAIDTELGLSAGSTSYYARSRRDLIVLIVERLAAHTRLDMATVRLPEPLTVVVAAEFIARALGGMLRRSDEHAVRIALQVEYRNDPEIRALLAGDPPVRPQLVAMAGKFLEALGAEDMAAADDLVDLVDSLLMQHVVLGRDTVAVERIVRNYLAGLVFR